MEDDGTWLLRADIYDWMLEHVQWMLTFYILAYNLFIKVEMIHITMMFSNVKEHN